MQGETRERDSHRRSGFSFCDVPGAITRDAYLPTGWVQVRKTWTSPGSGGNVSIMDFDEDIDARGLLCPLPVLKLRKRLMTMTEGHVARLRADDPAATIDVPHFCTEAGHVFLGQIEGDGAQNYFVRKTG